MLCGRLMTDLLQLIEKLAAIGNLRITIGEDRVVASLVTPYELFRSVVDIAGEARLTALHQALERIDQDAAALNNKECS